MKGDTSADFFAIIVIFVYLLSKLQLFGYIYNLVADNNEVPLNIIKGSFYIYIFVTVYFHGIMFNMPDGKSDLNLIIITI